MMLSPGSVQVASVCIASGLLLQENPLLHTIDCHISQSSTQCNSFSLSAIRLTDTQTIHIFGTNEADSTLLLLCAVVELPIKWEPVSLRLSQESKGKQGCLKCTGAIELTKSGIDLWIGTRCGDLVCVKLSVQLQLTAQHRLVPIVQALSYNRQEQQQMQNVPEIDPFEEETTNPTEGKHVLVTEEQFDFPVVIDTASLHGPSIRVVHQDFFGIQHLATSSFGTYVVPDIGKCIWFPNDTTNKPCYSSASWNGSVLSSLVLQIESSTTAKIRAGRTEVVNEQFVNTVLKHSKGHAGSTGRIIFLGTDQGEVWLVSILNENGSESIQLNDFGEPVLSILGVFRMDGDSQVVIIIGEHGKVRFILISKQTHTHGQVCRSFETDLNLECPISICSQSKVSIHPCGTKLSLLFLSNCIIHLAIFSLDATAFKLLAIKQLLGKLGDQVVALSTSPTDRFKSSNTLSFTALSPVRGVMFGKVDCLSQDEGVPSNSPQSGDKGRGPRSKDDMNAILKKLQSVEAKQLEDNKENSTINTKILQQRFALDVIGCYVHAKDKLCCLKLETVPWRISQSNSSTIHDRTFGTTRLVVRIAHQVATKTEAKGLHVLVQLSQSYYLQNSECETSYCFPVEAFQLCSGENSTWVETNIALPIASFAPLQIAVGLVIVNDDVKPGELYGGSVVPLCKTLLPTLHLHNPIHSIGKNSSTNSLPATTTKDDVMGMMYSSCFPDCNSLSNYVPGEQKLRVHIPVSIQSSESLRLDDAFARDAIANTLHAILDASTKTNPIWERNVNSSHVIRTRPSAPYVASLQVLRTTLLQNQTATSRKLTYMVQIQLQCSLPAILCSLASYLLGATGLCECSDKATMLEHEDQCQSNAVVDVLSDELLVLRANVSDIRSQLNKISLGTATDLESSDATYASIASVLQQTHQLFYQIEPSRLSLVDNCRSAVLHQHKA